MTEPFDTQEYKFKYSYYMEGFCMYMAAALHHHFGFPLGFAGWQDNEWKSRHGILHAWVVLPNGKYLDFSGERSPEEVKRFYFQGMNFQTPVLRCPLTYEEFEAIMGYSLSWEHSGVKQALEDGLQYIQDLKPYLVGV